MSEKSITLFPGVVLVTGAASGIGRQIAISSAIEGCRKLALSGKDSTGLNATKAAIKTASGDADPDVFIKHINNLDTYEVGKIMELTIRHFGRIDYAVNCAGMPICWFTFTPTHNVWQGIYGPTKKSHEATPEEFDHVINTNFHGLMSQDVGITHDGRPGFRGSIVNIGTTLGLVGKPETRENTLYFEQARNLTDNWDSDVQCFKGSYHQFDEK
ncbi:hypothetical protein FMUND_5765 [Fusarium mundagurra]|uniref:NAD(P)-binding protein n=1 Tax=Fusarium mundagurra TaxID=1567541 RepID=A0A8H5YSH1_9HYPO|nr:hypothetical protein FMUND_5765 [Fusarium mundagurra]